MAHKTTPDRTLADGEHRPLRPGNGPGNPRMEQRNPPGPESRRRCLVDAEGWREETLHVRVIPPTEMPQHRSRIPNGSSTPTIHRPESARDTLHELYQANGVVQGRPLDGER